ncbi:MAG: hypothetical protein QW794_00560 [Thermosphaera sp.]
MSEIRQLLSELQEQLRKLEREEQAPSRPEGEAEEKAEGLRDFYKSALELVKGYSTSAPVFSLDDWIVAKTLVSIAAKAPVREGTLVEVLDGAAVLAQFAPRSRFKRIVVNDVNGVLQALVSEAQRESGSVIALLALLPASRELVSIAKDLLKEAKLRGLSSIVVASLVFYALHANPQKYKYADAVSTILEVASRLRDVEFVSKDPLSIVDSYSTGGNTLFYLSLSNKYNLEWALPILDKIITFKDYWLLRVRLFDQRKVSFLVHQLQLRYKNVNITVERKRGTGAPLIFLFAFNWLPSSPTSEERIEGLKRF